MFSHRWKTKRMIVEDIIAQRTIRLSNKPFVQRRTKRFTYNGACRICTTTILHFFTSEVDWNAHLHYRVRCCGSTDRVWTPTYTPARAPRYGRTGSAIWSYGRQHGIDAFFAKQDRANCYTRCCMGGMLFAIVVRSSNGCR